VLQEAELSGQADSENNLGGSSETMYYIGLDVHKKTISFCVKDAAGCVLSEGKINSNRRDLDVWLRTLPQPRMIAMEATIFTGWIYDHLLPHINRQLPQSVGLFWLLYPRSRHRASPTSYSPPRRKKTLSVRGP
jgi:hypothetical protein